MATPLRSRFSTIAGAVALACAMGLSASDANALALGRLSVLSGVFPHAPWQKPFFLIGYTRYRNAAVALDCKSIHLQNDFSLSLIHVPA